MDKIKKIMKKFSHKNLFKKISIKIFTILFLLIILTPISFSFAQTFQGYGGGSSGGAGAGGSIPIDGKGLVPACAHLAADGSAGPQCTLQDLFQMFKPIRDILIYAVVIIIVGYTLYAGIGLVFYGDIPEYRQKLKKIFKNGVIAIVILITAASLVFAALVSFGFNQNILAILKQIFAFNDFNIIPHALAQTTTASTSNQYIDLFPQQGWLSTIQRAVKFFIYYIAAPILSFGVIWAGFRFVKAEGNPEELASAKKFATWMIIAIAIAIAAPLLVNMLAATIKAIIG